MPANLVRIVIACGILVIVAKAKANTNVRTLFSTQSHGVLFEIIADPAQTSYWKQSAEAPAPVYIRIAKGSISKVYYNKCGMLFGVLKEGLAMRPDTKLIRLEEHNGLHVTFGAKNEIVAIKADDLNITLSWNQARDLVKTLDDHWSSRPSK
jgi:hypothetical protein